MLLGRTHKILVQTDKRHRRYGMGKNGSRPKWCGGGPDMVREVGNAFLLHFVKNDVFGRNSDLG